METELATGAMIQQTEHPYIVRVAGICGGRPIIKGARVAARLIAELYKAGDTVEEILRSYAHLQGAAIFDVLSYYLDHQTEIEQEISANRLETVMEKSQLAMDDHGALRFSGRLRRRRLSMAQDLPRLLVSLYTDEDVTSDSRRLSGDEDTPRRALWRWATASALMRHS